MHQLLSRLTVKFKITLAFLFVMLTLFVIAVLVLMHNSQLSASVSSIFINDLPLSNKIKMAANKFDESVVSMGFYLLGKEEAQWEIYQEKYQEAVVILQEIETQTWFSNMDKVENLLIYIRKKLDKYQQLSPIVRKMATDYSFNLPALNITIYQLGPLTKTILTHISFMQISEQDEEYSEDRVEVGNTITNLKENWLRMTNEYRIYLAFRFPVAVQTVGVYKALIKQDIADLNKLKELQRLTFDQEESVSLISKTAENIFRILDTAIDVQSSDEWRKDTYLIRTTISPLIKDIISAMTQLQAIITSRLVKRKNGIVQVLKESTSQILIIIIIGLISGGLIAWAIAHHILFRLNQTVKAMHEISDGDGNLNTRLDEMGKDEMSLLAISFNKFVNKISGIVNLVIQSSTSLAEEASRMLEVVSKTETGVEKQRVEIDSISQAVRDMTDKIEEIATNSSEAAASARNATEEAREGQRVVDSSASAIQTLAQEVEQAVDVITRVEKESEDISIVVSVIRGISEQTNLLALNAAIEAARAGEHGRGFAVVADEVRNLSAKIQGQSNEIIGRIETLQYQSRQAVTIMTNGYETAKNSVHLSNKAGEALSHITGRVEAISQTSSNIANATEYQSQVAANIAENINILINIAEETSEGAMLTSRSASEFRSMSKQLQGLVEQFLLDQKSSSIKHKGNSEVTSKDKGQADDDIFF